MDIAFCINKIGMIGLGATLTSLIRNCSNANKLHFWFFCAYLTGEEKEQITYLIKNENFSGKYRFVDFDPIAIFGSFRSLHGDWTTYGRLLIPDTINKDQVLYLDSDLIIENDVLMISKFDFNGYAIGAVNSGILKNTLENKFYSDILGMSPELSTFNAGVLLFNLKLWREKSYKDCCISIANKHPMELLSADQSILNSVFAGKFAELPNSFNCPWYAYNGKPTVSEKMIIHFVGSPKPWDIFGMYIHNGYNTWKKYLTKDWENNFNRHNYKEYRRVWEIRKSYIRVIMKKIKY